MPALERITQHLRMVQRHALRVFTQCRKELQPLYDALRRSSSLAEGAALALHRLQRDGMDPWIDEHKIPVSFMRWQNVPSEQAINRTLDNVADAEPTTAPQIRLSDEQIVPEDYLKFQRLRELAGELRDAAPVEDLIGWVLRRHENSTTSETLSGVTQLMFGSEFTVRFAGDMEPRTYVTVDGTLEAYPLTAVLK
ncbi:MAG: hypothetical protein R2815_02165 [Flavobacteriales bacterium]